MSNSRKQIEAWLKTIDVKGSVLDVGGLFWPVKGRTKTWEVDTYHLADVKASKKGVVSNYVLDLNYPSVFTEKYDNVFLVEVVDHLWNPIQAFQNISNFLNSGGKLFISSNFLFPHHTGFDCIRLTKTGLQKILTETGFKVLSITPRYAVDDTLKEAMAKESKVDYAKGEIGYMVVAKKI